MPPPCLIKVKAWYCPRLQKNEYAPTDREKRRLSYRICDPKAMTNYFPLLMFLSSALDGVVDVNRPLSLNFSMARWSLPATGITDLFSGWRALLERTAAEANTAPTQRNFGGAPVMLHFLVSFFSSQAMVLISSTAVLLVSYFYYTRTQEP